MKTLALASYFKRYATNAKCYTHNNSIFMRGVPPIKFLIRKTDRKLPQNTKVRYIKASVFTLLYAMSLSMYGQDTSWRNIYKSTITTITSPEVAGMERYGTYPVDMNVGIPNITIPIYTIKSGGLEHSISLSYHMGGIKVGEIASWVGLGWSLNVGGSVSRQIKGRYDEYKGFLDNVVPNGILVPEMEFKPWELNEEAYYFANNIARHDPMSDVYRYNVIDGISGSFMYNTDKEIVQIPYTDNLITRNTNDERDFIIYGDDGRIYKFETKEYEEKIFESGTEGYPKAWLLSNITHPSSNDKINFIYGEETFYRDTYPTTKVGVCNASEWSQTSRIYTADSRERLLKKIEFNGGSIEFILSNETRKDRRKYKLEQILIKNSVGRQIKKVIFEYDYFKSSTNESVEKRDYRLKLKSVSMYGNNNSNPQIYRFTYNETVKLAPYFDSSLSWSNLYFGQDLWGYNNGVTSNTHMIHSIPTNSTYKRANRDANETYMKASILTRIDYPTGGYTIFETEANKDASGKTIGGLRIRNIISKADSFTPELIENYAYENPEYVYELTDDLYTQKIYIDSDIPGGLSRPYTTYSEHPFFILEDYSGCPVIYKKVTKRESDSQENRKTVYTYDGFLGFDYEYLSVYYYEPPLLYNRYSFAVGKDYHYMTLPRKMVVGRLKKEEHFSNDYPTPIKTILYDYEVYNKDHIPVGMCLFDRWLIDNPIQVMTSSKYLIAGYQAYEYWFVYVNTGYQYLKKKTENTYDFSSGETTSQVTEYKHGNITATIKNNLLLTERKIYGSKNDFILETYKYPQDFSSIEPYKTMVSMNILSPVIEKVQYRNETFLCKEKIEYKNWGDNLIAPEFIRQQFSGTALEPRITYYNYDTYGNALYSAKDETNVIVYLWSYSGQYPIAEIKNATLSEVESAVKSVFEVASINALATLAVPNESKLQDGSLQSALPNAHVTTYTYQPLVGMLTVTTPAGLTITYEYNAYGRLLRKKDHAGNVIEEYEYNYAN